MEIPTREALLGASDIRTREVDLPSLSMTVKIRSLPAGYSNVAQSEATEVINRPNEKGRIEQAVVIDEAKLQALKVQHGLVEPELNSIEDAHVLSQKLSVGTWKLLVDAIDELSGLTPEAAEQAERLFRDSGSGAASDAAGRVSDSSGESGSGAEAADESSVGNGRSVVSSGVGT